METLGESCQSRALTTLSSSKESGFGGRQICPRHLPPHVHKITFISLNKHTDTHLQTLTEARVPSPKPTTDVEILLLLLDFSVKKQRPGLGLMSDY